MRVLENFKAVGSRQRGWAWRTWIATTVFLKSMGDFAAMNEIYARYFAPQGVVGAGSFHGVLRSRAPAQGRAGRD